MPFASEKQRRYLHAHPEKLGPKELKHWDKASKGKKLPEHARRKKKASLEVNEKIALLRKVLTYVETHI